MHRKKRSNAAFDALCEQRDDVAIQVSLAWDAEPADLVRLSALQRKLRALDFEIFRYNPADAGDAIAVASGSH